MQPISLSVSNHIQLESCSSVCLSVFLSLSLPACLMPFSVDVSSLSTRIIQLPVYVCLFICLPVFVSMRVSFSFAESVFCRCNSLFSQGVCRLKLNILVSVLTGSLSGDQWQASFANFRWDADAYTVLVLCRRIRRRILHRRSEAFSFLFYVGDRNRRFVDDVTSRPLDFCWNRETTK